MNSALLIQAVVRQTTVLIAALATAAGQRAQLASLSNLVFADLVRELREQGLGNKVIADMFGMALRTYHRKLARLSASRTVAGKSLWEAVLGYIQQRGSASRAEILTRFAGDDEATLRSVLLDLADTGLVQRHGSDDATSFSALEPKATTLDASPSPRALEAMVLVALHRNGPLSVEALTEFVPVEVSELEAALQRLSAAGMIHADAHCTPASFRCDTCVIQFGDEAGWEAAVFDHYQAMVAAIATKLRAGVRRAHLADSIGGSTFVFDVWDGHPLQSAVLGYLKAMREQGMQLRAAVEQYNAGAAPPAAVTPQRVTAYVGQSVAETDGGEHAQ